MNGLVEREHRWRRHPLLWVVLPVLLVVVVIPALAVGAVLVWAATTDFDPIEFVTDEQLDPPPDPEYYGTQRDVGTRGDDPNPGTLYRGTFASGTETQERRLGAPARLSGYTTWVHSVERVPAPELVDGYQGDYLRLRVTIFNRDRDAQTSGALDFSVWHRDEGARGADFVGASGLDVLHRIGSGDEVTGDVYVYVGEYADGLFVTYDPEGGGDAVWEVPPVP